MANSVRPTQRVLTVALVAIASAAVPCTARAAALVRNPETQTRLSLRYTDRVLVEQTIALQPEKAAELYREVLTHIVGKYVDEVKLDRLLDRGLDNLEQALHNPAFLAAIAPPRGLDGKRLAKLQDTFRRRWPSLDADSIQDAVEHAVDVANGIRMALALSDPGSNRHNLVILEFVHAACEALDPHSCYLGPSIYEYSRLLARDGIAGVGIELERTQKTGPLTITSVLPGGPAAKDFIQPGDQLLKIGDVATDNLTPIEAQLLLHGPVNDPLRCQVGLVIKSSRDGTIRPTKLTRGHTDLSSISHYGMIDADAGIAYIHLQVFGPTAIAELDRALADLRDQGMRGLVLDLRGNPGGSFGEAIRVADRFLGEGVIVATQGRANGSTTVHRAGPDGDCTTPLVVLVDGETASAAEIVAGAFKDHQRAVLVGTKTLGKGSVQGMIELNSLKSALRLTTAKYLTPAGTSLAGQGISPDIVVDSPELPGMNSMTPAGNVQEAQNKSAIQELRRLLGQMPLF